VCVMQRTGFGMPTPYSCKRWQTEQIKFDSAEVGGPVAFPDTVFIVTSAGLWGGDGDGETQILYTCKESVWG
jgi:hypothetical protein